MGFGILFFGYFLCLNVTYNLWTDVFAYAIMLYAMTLLSRYEKNFKFSMYFLIPLIISAAVGFGCNVYEYTGGSFSPTLVNYIGVTEYIFALVVTVLMLSGIRSLAGSLELNDIKFKATRNIVFTCIYYTAMTLMSLDIGLDAKTAAGISAVFLLFGIITIILNAILVYSCYRWICLEGEEDNPRRRSRFAFINRMNDAFDSKEAAAIEKTLTEARERETRRSKKRRK